MAIMHPKSVFEFNSVSEEKMYHALKNQLSDNYEVFYSVVWYSKNEKNNRINSEADFIIVDKEKGFICVEVKGGEKYVHENDKYIVYNSNGEKIEKNISAYQQAENSMRYFINNYEKVYNMEYKGIYGFMAAFPNYELKEHVEEYFNQVKDVTIDVNDMNCIEQCVKKAFIYWGRKCSFLSDIFVAETRKKVCDMFKRIYAIEASKGALIEYKNKELEKINEVQNNIINLLRNYKNFAMKGAAGTGKSWIAYKMACIKGIKNNRETLLVSKSKYLSAYFKSINNISGYNNLYILSFDELLKEINQPNIKDIDYKTLKKFGVIIVDEAQDFSAEEAIFIRSLLYEDENSEFYVFYDDEQNLYRNNLDEILNDFLIDTKPYILTENLRNTKNIYEWAKIRTSLGEISFSNQIDGPEPTAVSLNTINQVIRYINQVVIGLIERDGVQEHFINIIIDDELYEDVIKQEFSFNIKNQIASSTEKFVGIFKVSEFKGMESNIIIYLHNENVEYSYKYVGLTRARFYLYDIELKQSMNN
ncbi:MAG: NERD domain-containing protein [Clostridia bacterium]|nr:NERD domain-containing protein [Clostridia bacterium]